MTIAEAVAERTKEFLEKKNMSQYRLAKNMLVYQQTLANLMTTKQKSVNLKTIFLICNGLGITILEFFDSPLFLNMDKLDIE